MVRPKSFFFSFISRKIERSRASVHRRYSDFAHPSLSMELRIVHDDTPTRSFKDRGKSVYIVNVDTIMNQKECG